MSRPLALFAALFALSSAACHDQLDVLAPGPDGSMASEFSASELSVGQYHSCAIRSGRPFCWGTGTRGALGRGPDVPIALTAAPISARLSARSLAAGELHTCSLDAVGAVSCWGANDQGQLGLGDLTDRFDPERVPLPLAATRVVAGYLYTCAILSDQSLWCWGQNYEGQLAQGDEPDAAGIPNPIQVNTDRDWLDASAGQGHTCGIRAPGALYCWGRNNHGELGLGSGASIQVRRPTRVGTDDDWSRVSVGQIQTCALKTDGSIWCWGSGTDGQLGLGDRGVRSTPERIETSNAWSSVSLNTLHACATTNGEIWCWGRNVEGQLGTGDTEDRLVPDRVGGASDWTSVGAGRFFTCARKRDGTIWCAGANDEGELASGDAARQHVLTKIVSE